MSSPIGLYIHVPFCRVKCHYCDFYSLSLEDQAVNAYIAAVLRNLDAMDERFDTLYFGGGTPILIADKIGKILEKISGKLTANAEISLEANPESTTTAALTQLKQSGINRLSIGVQSLNDNELKALGRIHNADYAKRAIASAYNIGFTDISADIMLGIPQQTEDSLIKTIDELTELPISHISAYMLKVEENTRFGRSAPILPEVDSVADFYSLTQDKLLQKGFLQYEISNFAKSGMMCKHNLKYWLLEDYYGIGPAAHSCYKGKRFGVKRDLVSFISQPIQSVEITDEFSGGFDEWLMLRLRLSEGINLEALDGFGIKKTDFLSKLKRIPKNLYHLTDNQFSLSKDGFLLSNSIIATLLSE